jgi:hypothetical protein
MMTCGEIHVTEIARLRAALAAAEARATEAEEILVQIRLKCDGKSVGKIIEERDALADQLAFIRDEWSPSGARACPACVYDNGKFIRRCKIHEEYDRLAAEATTPTSSRTSYATSQTHDRAHPGDAKGGES